MVVVTADTTIFTPTTSTLSTSYHATTISTANDTTKTTEVESTVDTSAAETIVFKGVNVAELFTKFQQAVQQVSTSRLFFIESFVHELLALSNIFLLCPGQYSPLCIDIFTEGVLYNLNKKLLTECLDFSQDMNDDACMKLSRIVNGMESNILSRNDAEIDLLMLGKSLNPFERPLVWELKLSECELFTMCFNPILPALFSDPDKNAFLRWSNVISDESGKIRPDATISKICQRDFGPSRGYGEAKLARPTAITMLYVTISCA
ncbi:hypothetical protein G6F43_011646 [Rhizopus delemar]|nr:hypothetical protein G6F43_011646 [Rhizopus delemar]